MRLQLQVLRNAENWRSVNIPRKKTPKRPWVIESENQVNTLRRKYHTKQNSGIKYF